MTGAGGWLRMLPKIFSNDHSKSENYFDRELYLPFRNRRSYQGARCRAGQGCPVCGEDVRVAVTRSWRGKVCMIENIEYFSAELHVEILRDFPDVIVLENREVQTGYARANQAVAASIP